MSPVFHTARADIPAYRTKDGSEIRELMHPDVHGNRQQSLAEATVPPGTRTLLHRHRLSEELYHVTAGHGVMTLGERRFLIAVGDTVHIAPGTAHALENSGDQPLVVLCACSPAYRHDDTELLEAEAGSGV
ncbi:mannose-6-phosphate isomerase [Azospira oryzae PS]|jgi:mannose-6-phosphate isomerase-like protein (cupin superfamily)|uniref:Mannose-6-phosphate isomerase n=2 Tax=Azospira oryzae TaxID=146939 RepID=G8QJC1_AZOOP|nr:cupin domain-containing protein [Azospira oryzae]AEV27590.1 mannose-6-phosphate isomerase [Azospira oryzae PS]RZT90458.1 mannose-6-phosphate isomerase-like protein (cupin superfamily) [Azospira oryzae]